MKKSIINSEAHYTIAWSALYRYDKYAVRSSVPELGGIVLLTHLEKGRQVPMLVYSCWRDGCRVGLNKLMDPLLTRYRDLMEALADGDLYFRYTVADTTLADSQDIIHCLIRRYRPRLNAPGFPSSGRYSAVYLAETDLGDSVVEKFSRIR